jgi:transcriptional regulator with XRE-family HTH domain
VVVAPDPVDRRRDLGSFIREQRAGARMSLRRLSELAGVSNPYLSQIERGLRRPSADILQQLAKALRISAETLYVQAGILDPPTTGADLVAHIRADPHLAESQKQALVQIYLSFRREQREQREQAGHAEHADHEPPQPNRRPEGRSGAAH